MKKLQKRFLGLLLSFLLAFTTVIIPVSADTGLTVTSFDAVANMLVINFSADVTDATGSITLTKDGVAMVSTTTVSGKKAIVVPSEDFVENVAYGFEIPAGFGGATTTDTKINKFFKLTKVFFDNFDGYTLTEPTATQTYLATNYYHTKDSSKFYPRFARVANGRLLLGGSEGTFYVKSTGIAELEDYSLSFNYKVYGPTGSNESKFYVAINATDATTHLDKNSNPAPTLICRAKDNGESDAWFKVHPGKVGDFAATSANAIIQSTGCIAGTYTMNTWWTPCEPTEVTGRDFEISVVKKGRKIECYVDGMLLQSYSFNSTVSPTTKGYLGFLPAAYLSSLDDLAVMTCAEIEDPNKPVITALTDIDGTCDLVKLTFDQDMTGCTNAADKITIYDGAKAMDDITYKLSGKTVVAYSEKGFEPDKTYRMFIESGLGNARIKTDTDYVKEFRNTKVFFDNFDTYTLPAVTAEQAYLSTNYYNTYDNSKFYPALARVSDGRLLLGGGTSQTFYVKSADIASLEDYSLSFNYKTYGAADSRSDFLVAFNTKDTTTHLSKDTNPAPTITYLNRANKYFVEPTNGTYYLRTSVEHPATDGIAGTYAPAGNYWGANVPTEVTGTDYEYSIVKKGRKIECFVDGELVLSYTFNNNQTGSNTSTKGYLGFVAYANLSSIDDLAFTTFTTNDPSNFNVCGFYIEDQNGAEITTAAQLAAATTITGAARVENYSGVSKDLTLVVAIYGDNNMMLDAKVLYNTSLADGQHIEEPITFTGVSNVKKVKVFAFDSFENLTPYCADFQIPASN